MGLRPRQLPKVFPHSFQASAGLAAIIAAVLCPHPCSWAVTVEDGREARRVWLSDEARAVLLEYTNLDVTQYPPGHLREEQV